MLIRAGIALADVSIEGRDRSGTAIASVVPLQEAAPPTGIAMTHLVRWQLSKALAARFTRIVKTLKAMASLGSLSPRSSPSTPQRCPSF